MKKVGLLITLLLGLSTAGVAQRPVSFDPNYRFLRSDNRVADKNFYLLTVIRQSPDVRALLRQDAMLHRIGTQRVALIRSHVSDTCTMAATLLTDFRWSRADSARVAGALQTLYTRNRSAFDRLVDEHLRPSGYYQLFAGQNNAKLLGGAWGQCVVGTNYIIDQFGLGKKLRYPRIDSANYNVNSRYYRIVLKDLFAYLNERIDSMGLFYQPSLAVAMRLMDANDRDEPARHEPMQRRDNRRAYERVDQVRWADFRYAAIVVPGNGPELTSTPLSPLNKMRLDLVADRYARGWAPFIIVGGGYCYPFRGPYAEAVEMKRYLMQKHAVPEEAILIDPHARHTTTNFRNANRLLIRYRMPIHKPLVCVTTRSQTDYIDNPAFDARNKRELGYLPYRAKQRLTDHDISFYPTLECLHMDPFDPLDP